MYFKEFPLRYYTLNKDRYIIPDIISRVRFKDSAINSASVFIDYVIDNNESPQKLSTILYDSPVYDWVIFMFNDIYDYYEQWPMDDTIFNDYVSNKYGSTNIYNIHHYENKSKEIVESTHPAYDRVSVSNYEYEESINDNKRTIRLLNPKYLDSVVNELKELLDE